jgi:hypothetical protein
VVFDFDSWATLRIPCAAASWLAIDAERSPNLPRGAEAICA